MNDLFKSIQDVLLPAGLGSSIQDFANLVTDYGLVLVAVGTITMALLELFKSIVDWRMKFHRKRLRLWTSEDGPAYDQLIYLASGTPPGDWAGRRRSAGMFARGEIHPEDALFDQATEKMMGQLQAAANVALDFPDRYGRLYDFLARDDFRYFSPHPELMSETPRESDANLWRRYVREAMSRRASEELSAAEKQAAREATQARARIANLVHRKLDAFQNQTAYLWEEYNQRVTFIGSATFLFIFLKFGSGNSILGSLVLSFFGGLIAPFAKDLVSALSSISLKKA